MKRDRLLIALASIAAILIVCADAVTPLGYGVWALYLLPMLILSVTGQKRTIYTAAVLTPLLMAAGLFLSPPNIPVGVAIVNRGAGYLVLWIVVITIASRFATIDKLRASEQRTRESESNLRQLLQAANSIILRWSPSGTLIFVNDYGLIFFGYTADELVGKNVMALAPGVDSTGRDLTELTEEMVNHPENFANFVNENVRKDGERVWVSWTNKAIVDDRGNVREVLAIGNDITERKRAEQQLRATLESIGDGFFACDADWKIVYVNAPAERILGIRREEVLGKSHWDIFPNTLGTRLEHEYRRAAAGEIRDFENYYEPWGRWFHNRCFPREGGGISVYFEEITEIKRAEEEREGLIRQTEHDKQKLELLAETLEERVAKRTEQVTALSKALTLAEQRERIRFSRILHEDLQQILLAAKARLDIIEPEKLGDEETRADFAEVGRLTAKALGTSKALALEMNPPILKSEGLDAALKWLAHHMGQRYDLSIDTDITARLYIVEEELGVLVIQIVREVLFAAIKQAPGTHINLRASFSDGTLWVDLENRDTALPDIWISKEDFFEIRERLKLFRGRIETVVEPGRTNLIRIILPIS